MDCIKCKATLPDGALFCPLCGKKQTPEVRKRRKRANGSGTIYKMPGNRAKPWAAQRNGIFIGSFKTYAAAQKALERITDVDVTDRYNLTFSQIYERWRPVHARTVTKGQMACYEAAYKSCTELHGQKFRLLRKSDFQTVVVQLEEEGKAKSTCEKMMQLFGQLSKWAMDEGIVNQNHARNVTIAARQKNIKRPFTDQQIAAIQQSKHRAAGIALILIATGARINELFKVPVKDCRDAYFIGGSKTGAGERRVIAVSPIGRDAYCSLLQKARDGGHTLLIEAFEGNKNTTNFRKRDFKELMDEIGVEGMTPHSCRHTFSTLAARGGVTPQILRRMMGHADIKTTDKIYTHLEAEDILAEIDKVDSSLAVASKLQANQTGSEKTA